MSFGSYRTEDVQLLLKDITGLVQPTDTAERERRIQSGTPYSEMLPIEYEPSAEYENLYERALRRNAQKTADAVASVAAQIYRERAENTVLVSLARAGTPIGILLKRFLALRFGVNVPHYSISILRGGGIDANAMDYILRRHKPEQLQFVDGWTGKGAISRELSRAMEAYPDVRSDLAVLADPAYLAGKCGTHEDFLIASSCLNATVSGLLSRTFYRPDIIGEHDFHGAIFYRELQPFDRTASFLDTVTRCFSDTVPPPPYGEADGRGLEEAEEIRLRFGIADLNRVKPGVGEATRVLLRRMPWKILVHRMDDEEHLGHLYRLAREKGIPLSVYPLRNYRACGLIRSVKEGTP